VLSKCSKFVELEHTETVTTRFYLTRVVPVGVTMALTLALGNTVYLHLGVALIQVKVTHRHPAHASARLRRCRRRRGGRRGGAQPLWPTHIAILGVRHAVAKRGHAARALAHMTPRRCADASWPRPWPS